MSIVRSVLALLVTLGLFACSEQLDLTESDSIEGQTPDALSGSADWILTNGKILTVDEDFSIVQAIAVEDGRILATGTDEQVMAHAGTETEYTDLAGQTVIPGLIDNHMHFVRATKHWYRMVRLDGTKSRAEALAMIKERHEQLAEGEWLMVMGGFILEQFQDDSSIFTLEELDALVPDRPLYIQEGYSRAFVNSAALEATGITKENTTVGVMKNEQGELTGELRGNRAYGLVDSKIPEPSQEAWNNSVKYTIQDMLSHGMTTVYDLGGRTVTPVFYDAVNRIDDQGELNMRVYYSLNGQNSANRNAGEIIGEMTSNTPDNDSLRFAQFGYGEAVYSPMRANPFQVSEEDQEHFRNIVLTALENGWQLHEHVERDIKARLMLDLLEEIAETHPEIRDMRFTIAHTDSMQPDSIQRAKDLGMVFGVHASRRQDTLISSPILQSQPPASLINDLGGVWGLGSDSTTVGSPRPMHTIGWIVSGRNIVGDITQPFTVSREDALTAHTRTNGYILFREDDLGSLEVGKLADFVVLSDDYMTVPEEEIENLVSLMTVVEGDVVYTAE